MSIGLSLGFGGGIGAAAGDFGKVLSPLDGPGVELRYWVPFVPQPFYADQVMLSALGGWLRSRGEWNVVRKAKPGIRFEGLEVRELLGRLSEGGRLRRDVRGPAIARDRSHPSCPWRRSGSAWRRAGRRAGGARPFRMGAYRDPGPRPLCPDRLRRRAAAVSQSGGAGEGDRAQVQGERRSHRRQSVPALFPHRARAREVVRPQRSRHALQAGAAHDAGHARHCQAQPSRERFTLVLGRGHAQPGPDRPRASSLPRHRDRSRRLRLQPRSR